MKTILSLTACFFTLLLSGFSQDRNSKCVTVPMVLDHNRMLVDAEMQRKDGTWRKVRLWIDSGSSEFFISESLARDLGIELSATEDSTFKSANYDINPPAGLRIGGKILDFEGLKTRVKFQPYWLFTTMQSDGNLPATLLKKYHIVFDYPEKQLTISEPGSRVPQGIDVPITVNPHTGIVQMATVIHGESYSLALDMGASYSFISEGTLAKLCKWHPEWPSVTGTLGCANMWGWWPANEQQIKVVRIPQLLAGNMVFENVGIGGVLDFSATGPTLGEWYSRKTAEPVDGFIGANMLLEFRVEIDYATSHIYFAKGAKKLEPEMDMVGVSIRQLPDLSYQVVGIVQENGEPSVKGIEPEDNLISIEGDLVAGMTMGAVVDRLRGRPGEARTLLIKRNGEVRSIRATVKHYL